MDFHRYPQQVNNKTEVYSYDFEDDEDDVFYDELRRQVLQLTSEDDDGDYKKVTNTAQARKQGPYTRYGYYDWSGIKEDCAPAPAWILNLWRGGNGTGVFIPQNVQSRRKNRSRRKKHERGRTYKMVEETNR